MVQITTPPVPTTMAPRTRNRAQNGGQPRVNQFYDEGWLKASYDTQQALEVTVPGTYEEYQMKRGKRAGEVAEKLTGEANEVVRDLRDAAGRLGIGVTIETVVLTHTSGKGKGQPNGQITIKFMGKPRKSYKREAA